MRAVQDLQLRTKALEAGATVTASFASSDQSIVSDSIAQTTPQGDPASGQLVYLQPIVPVNVDGDFESANALQGITTWGGQNGATVEVTGGTGVLHDIGSGAGALAIIPDGVSANPLGASELEPIVASAAYSLSIWMYSDQGWATTQAGIAWYDVNSNYISTTLIASFALVATVGQMQTLTATSPSNAVYAQIVAQMTGTPTASTILQIDTAWLVAGTMPAAQSLAASITAVAGWDQYGNPFEQGATLAYANIVGAISLSTGVSGGSAFSLSPNVAVPLVITTLLSGIVEAAAEFTTNDVNEVFAGIIGSLILNTGTAAKQSAVFSSPFGTQGAAVVLQSQNDGGTDTASIIIGTTTTPDNTTLVFTPIAALYPSALLIYGGTGGQVVVTKTSGSGTIPIPAGVTVAKGECWGAGGGGGNGNGSCDGGGGGGEYSCEPNLAVTGGGTVAYTVGSGGTYGAQDNGGNPQNGHNGTNSTLVGSTVTVTGHAGLGGGTGGPGNYGLGGSGYAGTISNPGGPGGEGLGGHATDGGGGGGSSGSPLGNGNGGGSGTSGVGGTGASAPAGGGAGGHGGGPSPADTGLASGSAPGGGGGGGCYVNAAGIAYRGAPGAAGQVRLTYTTGNPLILFSVATASGTDLFGSTWQAGFAFKPGSNTIFGPGPKTVRHTGGQTVSSSSPTTLTGTTITLDPGAYEFEAFVPWNGTAASIGYLYIGGTATATAFGAAVTTTGNGVTTTVKQQNTFNSNTNVNFGTTVLTLPACYVTKIRGYITVSVAGTIQIGAATSGSTAFVTLAGGSLRVWVDQ